MRMFLFWFAVLGTKGKACFLGRLRAYFCTRSAARVPRAMGADYSLCFAAESICVSRGHDARPCLKASIMPGAYAAGRDVHIGGEIGDISVNDPGRRPASLESLGSCW